MSFHLATNSCLVPAASLQASEVLHVRQPHRGRTGSLHERVPADHASVTGHHMVHPQSRQDPLPPSQQQDVGGSVDIHHPP